MGCVEAKEVSKADLDFLLKRTQFAEQEIKKWFGRFAEECPDGKLTPTKFIALYQKLFPGEDAKTFCRHVFRTFDTDKSGALDFREFILAVYITSSATAEEKLKRTFRLCDVDGNGVIDLEEMVKVIQAFYDMLGSDNKDVRRLIRKKTAKERAEAIFRGMNSDKVGHLTEKEFMEGCHKDEELAQILVVEQSLSNAMLSLL